VVTDPQTYKHTNPQTGPITIRRVAKLSAQCKKPGTEEKRIGLATDFGELKRFVN